MAINIENCVFMLNKEEHYRTGKILGEITKGHFLVEFNPPEKNVNVPLEIYSIEEMTQVNSMGKEWFIFKNKGELDKWYSWINEPSGPKIVKLVK